MERGLYFSGDTRRMKATPQQILDYLKKNGEYCLYCGHDEVEFNPPIDDKHKIKAKTKCLKCHKTWTDIYTVTDVIV